MLKCGSTLSVDLLQMPNTGSVLARRHSARTFASCKRCGNGSIAYVVAALAGRSAPRPYESNTRHVPWLTVLRAVDGRNQTEVVETLLESGLSFHRLSSDNKRWGKLATYLSKHAALLHQLRTASEWQITLEDDVVLSSTFCEFVERACQRYLQHPDLAVIQLSGFAEVFMTSRRGAQTLVAGMRRQGIWRADDQTLFDTTLLHRPASDFKLRFTDRKLQPRPYALARATNQGEIVSTRRMTWTEMALLRLLTSPRARHLPNFGNPDGVQAITERVEEKCNVEACKPRNVFARGSSPWWSEVPGRSMVA